MSKGYYIIMGGLIVLILINVYLACIIGLILMAILGELPSVRSIKKKFKKLFIGKWKRECIGLRNGHGSIMKKMNILHRIIKDLHLALNKRKQNQTYQSKVADELFDELLRRDSTFDKIQWLKDHNLYMEKTPCEKMN